MARNVLVSECASADQLVELAAFTVSPVHHRLRALLGIAVAAGADASGARELASSKRTATVGAGPRSAREDHPGLDREQNAPRVTTLHEAIQIALALATIRSYHAILTVEHRFVWSAAEKLGGQNAALLQLATLVPTVALSRPTNVNDAAKLQNDVIAHVVTTVHAGDLAERARPGARIHRRDRRGDRGELPRARALAEGWSDRALRAAARGDPSDPRVSARELRASV